MGFDLQTSVSAITVFFQGLLSFLSPCVLPLVPLYLSYLAGGAVDALDAQARRRTLRNTLFFILGISFAFFVLGLGFTALGRFFSGNRALFARIGGILIILMGLWQLFGAGFSKELRLPVRLERWTMGPLPALLLGFTFSFAWTPCVGPTLSSVLILASTAKSRWLGFLLIGVYTLGFVLPFLAVGLFTTQVLRFFKRHVNWLKYTAKAGGVLLVLVGVMMLTGWMNSVTGYLSGLGQGGGPAGSSQQQTPEPTPEDDSVQPQATPEPGPESTPQAYPAPDFTLVDQNGVEHTLSDYKGQVVFLNFWATWCGPCQREMPDVQALYKDHGENAEDVVVLGVANPKMEGYPGNVDNKTAEEIAAYLEEGGYEYPVVMDETGSVFRTYGISAFPTTFMIDADGNLFGYVQGMLTREIMDDIVQQTLSGVRAQ